MSFSAPQVGSYSLRKAFSEPDSYCRSPSAITASRRELLGQLRGLGVTARLEVTASRGAHDVPDGDDLVLRRGAGRSGAGLGDDRPAGTWVGAARQHDGSDQGDGCGEPGTDRHGGHLTGAVDATGSPYLLT